MANEQTALAKLIKILERDIDNTDDQMLKLAINGCIIEALGLLPYEREQMEKCYNDGYDKGIYEYKNTTTKTDAIDYFNQNYKQDGK